MKVFTPLAIAAILLPLLAASSPAPEDPDSRDEFERLRLLKKGRKKKKKSPMKARNKVVVNANMAKGTRKKSPMKARNNMMMGKGMKTSKKMKGKKRAKTSSFALTPSEVSLTFPSANAMIKGSSYVVGDSGDVGDGSLFTPLDMAPLYDFGGPHFVQETFKNANKCQHGIERVELQVEATTDGMLNGTTVGFTLAINGLGVAEGTVIGGENEDSWIRMSDVFYPPIIDKDLHVTLAVTNFEGTLISSQVVSGVLISQLSSATKMLTLTCAAPFPAKGIVYKKGVILEREKKKQTLGSTPGGFQGCRCKHWPLVLPASKRTAPLFPNMKLYEDFHDYKRVLFPVPNEPFMDIKTIYRELITLNGNKLKVENTKQVKDIDDFYADVCGGRRMYGTIRMTGCKCNKKKVPDGYNPKDITFDFEVYCPGEDEFKPKKKGGGKGAY